MDTRRRIGSRFCGIREAFFENFSFSTKAKSMPGAYIP
jgi:hypothetical protein